MRVICPLGVEVDVVDELVSSADTKRFGTLLACVSSEDPQPPQYFLFKMDRMPKAVETSRYPSTVHADCIPLSNIKYIDECNIVSTIFFSAAWWGVEEAGG
eukprot:Sspe_Gene.35349::Locus_17135_Transcript_3_6_Confidence_0.600_Length_447::g.35349::m.35349